MNPVYRSVRAFLLLLISYSVLTCLCVIPVDSIVMLSKTTSVFFFFPAVSILVYFRTRIAEQRLRHYLSGIGVMIVFWSVLRSVKYIAFEECESAARFIWYLYYIPMISIPQLSFQAALSAGVQSDKKLPFIQNITGAVNIACILLVLTNDMHQLVFRFHPGFAGWNEDYFHEPLFWTVTIWCYLLFFMSAAVLFRKCCLSAIRRLVWIPVTYLIIGVTGLYILNIGRLPRVWGNTIGEFPDMACYTLGGFWILYITIGMVPSNKGYEKLLEKSSLAVRIADLNYNVVYQSSSAVPVDKELLKSTGQIIIDKNTLLCCRNVTGGYAYWQTDITELNKINCELEKTKEHISEESELIRQENELRENRARIDAKSKVYDDIAMRVLPQSQKIALISSGITGSREKFDKNMRLVCIYAVYIKRLSNMMLISSEGKIRKSELLLAVSESVRYLNKTGVVAEVYGHMDDTVSSAEHIIRVYECFENLLEQALPDLKALHAVFSDDMLKITFEGGKPVIAEDFKGTAETDEDITFIRICLTEEEPA